MFNLIFIQYFKQMISYIIYHILYIIYICLLVFMKYFKQMISYIIEGDLIYVYIYTSVLSIFVLLPSVFQYSSTSIILILKYINMILLSIFLSCLYSYFFLLYVFSTFSIKIHVYFSLCICYKTIL